MKPAAGCKKEGELSEVSAALINQTCVASKDLKILKLLMRFKTKDVHNLEREIKMSKPRSKQM